VNSGRRALIDWNAGRRCGRVRSTKEDHEKDNRVARVRGDEPFGLRADTTTTQTTTQPATSTTTTEVRKEKPATTTTETTTTTTTATGRVTTFSPGASLVLAASEGKTPISYMLSKTAKFLDRKGREIEASMVKPGANVEVTYEKSGDQMVVNRVIVDQ
jgi:hypothetical protein